MPQQVYSGASPLHACRSSTSFRGFESSIRSPSTPDFSCTQVACMSQQECHIALVTEHACMPEAEPAGSPSSPALLTAVCAEQHKRLQHGLTFCFTADCCKLLVQAASCRLSHLIFRQVVICQPVGLICSCLLSLAPPLTVTAVRELRVFRHRVASFWAARAAWLSHGHCGLQTIGHRAHDELACSGSIGNDTGCAKQVCRSVRSSNPIWLGADFRCSKGLEAAAYSQLTAAC